MNSTAVRMALIRARGRDSSTRLPVTDGLAPPEYWRELTEALASAGAVLLPGHGAGKANASRHWVAYVEKHHRNVAATVVAWLGSRPRAAGTEVRAAGRL